MPATCFGSERGYVTLCLPGLCLCLALLSFSYTLLVCVCGVVKTGQLCVFSVRRLNCRTLHGRVRPQTIRLLALASISTRLYEEKCCRAFALRGREVHHTRAHTKKKSQSRARRGAGGRCARARGRRRNSFQFRRKVRNN